MKFNYNIIKKNNIRKRNLYCKIILLFTLLNISNLYKGIFLSNLFLRKTQNILTQQCKNKMKVCLCVIGKGEKLYIKEYINYYEKLGYNHIFIYDNNYLNETNEKFVDVLKEEIQSGFVSIINFFNFRGKRNNPQFEAYFDCYKKNNRNYDWLSFFDFDEFLELNPKNQTIQEFLSNKRYKNCQSIKINWLMYESDKELLYYENKSLSIRFKKTMYKINRNKLIKTTVGEN